jgi:hypothetical protein
LPFLEGLERFVLDELGGGMASYDLHDWFEAGEKGSKTGFVGLVGDVPVFGAGVVSRMEEETWNRRVTYLMRSAGVVAVRMGI